MDARDVAAPTVRIVAPAPGQVVSEGSVALSAEAHDDVRVTRVEYWRTGSDGEPARIGDAAPSALGWAFEWKTSGVHDGAWRLVAKAFDAVGHRSTSPSVTIRVHNPVVSRHARPPLTTAQRLVHLAIVLALGLLGVAVVLSRRAGTSTT
jgi:hypothetical protein